MRKLLVLTHLDVYGDAPNGTTHAIRTLLDFLSDSWQIDVYSTRCNAVGANRPNIDVISPPASAKKRASAWLDQRLDNFLLQYFRRGFNRFFEFFLEQRQQRRPAAQRFRNQRALDLFSRFLDTREYAVVLVEYISNTYLLEAFGEKAPVCLLDMHDIMHLRTETFRKKGISHRLHITRDEEYALLRKYSYLLAIQRKEGELLRQTFGERVVVTPRPQTVVDCRLPSFDREALTIGFFASKAVPNLQAYDWFVDKVWGDSRLKGWDLEVVGSLCNVLSGPRKSRIRHLGAVECPAEAYRSFHICINPVQIGSGLKIKNLEALAHGRPVVTTALGAEGMEDAVGRGLLIADSVEEFVDVISRLHGRPDEIRRLSCAGQAFIRESFSPVACFAELESRLAAIELI